MPTIPHIDELPSRFWGSARISLLAYVTGQKQTGNRISSSATNQAAETIQARLTLITSPARLTASCRLAIVSNLNQQMTKPLSDRLRNLASRVALVCRFIIRSPREAFLVLRMATWVFLLSTLIRVLPLPRVLMLMTPRTPSSVPSRQSPSSERIAQLLDLLLGIDLFVFQPICWKRAAVLHRFLALHGMPTSIVFGVRKQNEGLLEGHAWLELGHEPILETNPPEYRVTYSFPMQSPIQH
ncbi:MAG TPA: lasso peptide biosynthesis B2 protein [Pyrinomonadaceae bacterium]|nr:lasso peptide biosynthesis B2 protein [Pyrinomonadaceae bacterium]